MLLGCKTGECSSSPNSEPDTSIQQQIQSVISAKNASEAAKRYEALFQGRDSKEIHGLICNDHTGIALRAAWEEIRRTLPETEEQHAVHLDPYRINYFLGLVEGRLRVDMPDWWRESLLSAKAYRRSNVFFPCKGKAYHNTGDGFSCPTGTSIQVRNGTYILEVYKQSITLSSELVEEAKDDGSCVSAIINSQEAYVAIHSSRCLPYCLFCIERKSARVLWKARAWAAGPKIYIGKGCHSVSISAQDDRVLLLGAGDDCIYAEAFASKDGANIFRFSTGY
jgi:hypothetical protein